MYEPTLTGDVLLKETYNELVAHPERHNQHMWAKRTACGTVGCFAGTAVMLAYGGEAQFLFAPFTSVTAEVMLDGKVYYIKELAKSVLGLDCDQAEVLFNPTNSIERIGEMLESWGVL